jgi:tetratricopeptide (TPR) repeat protein
MEPPLSEREAVRPSPKHHSKIHASEGADPFRVQIEPSATYVRWLVFALFIGATPITNPAGAQSKRSLSGKEAGLPASVSVRAPEPFARACGESRAAVYDAILADSPEARLELLYEAEAWAQEALRLRPESPEGYYHRAVALGLQTELVGARRKVRIAVEIQNAAETVLELDPRHAGGHHVLGRLHAGVMRLSWFTRFIATKLLGADKLRHASWDKAEEHLKTAEELQPELLVHHLELGILYRDTKRTSQAVEEMRHVLALPSLLPVDGKYKDRARRVLARLEEGEAQVRQRGNQSTPDSVTVPGP